MLLVFGAQSHGFTACSLRLKAASQPTNQGSLPVTRHVLPGGIQTHRVSIETFLCFHVFLPFPLIPISLGLAGATSVPRASGPARGTESQCFSFGERFALKKFIAHRLDWLAGTLALPRPEFALGHFGAFPFFVPNPLLSSKNQNYRTVDIKLPIRKTGATP
jgi:O-antigen ligase